MQSFLCRFPWNGTDPPLEKDMEYILDGFDLLYNTIEEQGPFEGVIGLVPNCQTPTQPH
jgi:hypothetical protein